jgi:hypothetical protein
MCIGLIGLGGLMLLPLVFLFVIPFGLVFLTFWIWMLIDAAQNKGLNDGERIAWILIIALVHFLGAIIYFFVGRPKGKVPSSVPA